MYLVKNELIAKIIIFIKYPFLNFLDKWLIIIFNRNCYVYKLLKSKFY